MSPDDLSLKDLRAELHRLVAIADSAERPKPTVIYSGDHSMPGWEWVLYEQAHPYTQREYVWVIRAIDEQDTAGAPRQLAMDEFPDYPAEMVMEVFKRGVVVGVRAGQFMQAPRFYRDKLYRLQGELAAAGYVAMGRSVRGPLTAAQRYPELHAVDDEEARGH